LNAKEQQTAIPILLKSILRFSQDAGNMLGLKSGKTVVSFHTNRAE